MRRIDIRPLKQQLRVEIKDWRRSLPPEQKRGYDEEILRRILELPEYQACHTVLTYVSMPMEVDTHGLIRQALSEGKRVAVPRCVPGTREMEFYYIRGESDLEKGTFGVMEPVPSRCALYRREEGSICIVPALAYDCAGFRLGYGAGYYDRFLSRYQRPKIGVIYGENVYERLWHGRYDVPVDLMITEENRMGASRTA